MEYDLSEKMQDGQPRYSELRNGTIYDHSIGRIVTGPTTGLITTENAREMQSRRVSLTRERTREGIAKGLGINLHEASGGEEWVELTRLFVEQFAKSKNLRGMAESYEKLGKASGYINQEEAPADIAERLARILEQYAPRETIEGTVKDVTDNS